MNKKGLQFKLAFFAVVIASMIIIAVGVVIGEWNTVYNSGLDYDLGSYSKLSEISGTAESQQATLSPDNPETDSNFESSTFRAAYSVITKIFLPFEVVFGSGGLIASVTTRFGIPDYVRQGIIAMAIFAFIFALVAIIFRIPGGTS